MFLLNLDLRQLYESIGRIPKINKAVVKLIENHVYENGIGDIAIKVCCVTPFSSIVFSSFLSKDSKTFVKTIIDIRKKFLEIFDIGPAFECALDEVNI